MKKRILGVAFMIMSLVAFGSIAQTQNTDNKAKQEKVENLRKEKKEKKGKKIKGDKTRSGKVKSDKKQNRKNPYEGLTLTETQKTQLQQLDSRRKMERREKSNMAKAEKQRRDSSARAERRAAKKQYLEEVKAIIGPDQYVVYLENQVLNGNKATHHKAFRDSKNKQGKMKAHGRHHADNRQTGRNDKNGKMKQKS